MIKHTRLRVKRKKEERSLSASLLRINQVCYPGRINLSTKYRPRYRDTSLVATFRSLLTLNQMDEQHKKDWVLMRAIKTSGL